MKKAIKTAYKALARTKAIEDMKRNGTNTKVLKKESELVTFLKNRVQF